MSDKIKVHMPDLEVIDRVIRLAELCLETEDKELRAVLIYTIETLAKPLVSVLSDGMLKKTPR